MDCLFVSDLHGNIKKYNRLYEFIQKSSPDAVFFGGDLLPLDPAPAKTMKDFIENNLFFPLEIIKEDKKDIQFFLILGNDDPRRYESLFKEADKRKIIHYVNQRTARFSPFFVTGYSFVPPTPFLLKDWERYDVSQFIDIGVIPPEKGFHTTDVETKTIRFETIQKDLSSLLKNAPPQKTIFLFHAPPYDTSLDRAALDGKKIDHAPVDVHIGSIAIKKFIEQYKPFITLHGHVHESSRMTGEWKQKIHQTVSFSAAYDHDKLAIVSFNTENPSNAYRYLLDI
ncbi:MAG: metallophosphoesterase [Thermoplasmatota archaeon]